jgi:hypothetical protein
LLCFCAEVDALAASKLIAATLTEVFPGERNKRYSWGLSWLLWYVG